MADAQDQQYLTPGQVARILHVSPKTIDRWADQGLIPCVTTLGGHRRFREDVVREVADKMFGEPPQQRPNR